MIKNFKLGKAILAGLLGTLAMTALMYGLPLVGLPRMDIMAALGSVFPFDVSPYVMGSVIHVATGISLGVLYALFFDSWLPGPGWFRGAVFSLAPWLFAITLLGPSLTLASEIFKGRDAVVANPCAVSANPCAVSNPCAANPRGAGAGTSSSGPSPQTMSLIAHLLFGVVVGGIYRPSRASTSGKLG